MAYNSDYKSKWIKTFNKPYLPLSNWVLKFNCKEEVTKGHFKIQTIHKNQIEEYFNKHGDLIWLIDNNNKTIPAINQTGIEQEKKTLKAVFSGHQLKIRHVKNEDNTYFIEVGVKNLFYTLKDVFKN